MCKERKEKEKEKECKKKRFDCLQILGLNVLVKSIVNAHPPHILLLYSCGVHIYAFSV